MRELLWLTNARQRTEWDHTTAIMAWCEQLVTGKESEPSRLNPYRNQPYTKSPEQLERENKRAWKLLDLYFEGGHYAGRRI